VKVLVTGFEPFNKEEVNPSWEVCKNLSEKINSHTVVVKQLPVVYDEAKEKVVHYCAKIHPDVVLLLGEAGGRTHISVERIAVNCDSAQIKDNKGQSRDNQPIEPDGHDGYFATIPVTAVVNALKKANIPAVVSNSAGTYLCNHVLYSVLHYVKKEGLTTKAGFIHVPYLPEQVVHKPGKASMSLELMVNAVHIAVTVCESIIGL
jgi:pyroglutamyl-peptidase